MLDVLSSRGIVAADAHVHVHPQADVGALLDAACNHFGALARELGAHEVRAALLLAEMRGARWFERTRERSSTVAGDWRLDADPLDPCVLRALRGDAQIALVAGRQVATREGLEVLALATETHHADGESLAATLDAVVRDADAIAVLPWAAGKWLGARGRLVREALRAQRACVGDNGGRPAFWRDADVLGPDARRRALVLPGSDPLPLVGEERRVGAFGFWVEAATPWRRPAAEIRALLATLPPERVHSYGHAERPWRFVRNQVALRLAARRSA